MDQMTSSERWKQLEDLNYQIYDTKVGELPPAGHWPQPGWFGRNAKVVFIGQNPGMMTKNDELFEHHRDQLIYLWAIKRSPTGDLISRAIEKAGLSWNDVAYTNIVKSPTPGNRVPTEEEIEYYRDILYAQLELYKPKKSVIFGSVAKNCFNVLAKKNTPYYNTEIPCMFVDHPSYVLRIGKELEYIELIANFIKE